MKIIIVGCGRVGSGLAITMSQSGHQVTVIDVKPEAFDLLPASFKGKKIIGYGFDREILLKAEIEKTDALAAVTASDEANAVIARLGSQVFRVPRVVARLYDERKADIYSRLGLQTIDPTAWGISRMVDLLCYSPLGSAQSLGTGTVDIIEVEVPALLIGQKVNQLSIPSEIIVVGITRMNKTFIPTLGTEFQERDTLHIAVTATSRDHLKSLLGLA